MTTYEQITTKLKDMYQSYGKYDFADALTTYVDYDKENDWQVANTIDRFQEHINTLAVEDFKFSSVLTYLDKIETDIVEEYGYDINEFRDSFLNYLKDAEDYFNNHGFEFDPNTAIKPEKATDPLGRYAFPRQRNPKYRVPNERDTKIEIGLIRDIQWHFSGYIPLPVDSCELIQSFLKTGKYSDIFKEPDCEKVYRGMSVTKQWLINVLNNSSPSQRGAVDMKFSFVPLKDRGGSSWSTSYEFALGWAKDQVFEEQGVAIVLNANVSDNKYKFMIGEGGLYKLNGPALYDDQHEAVGLDIIKVSGIEWDIRLYGKSKH
jgi:hypothetical protein